MYSSFSLRRFELQRRLCAGADVQLVIDVAEMPAHGAVGHAHPVCDLFVGEALREQFQDFPFARGKVFHLGCGGERFLK